MCCRVLLADPEESILAAFATSLTRRGFEVFTASNERDCVRHLCESAPDVVVLEPDTNAGWGTRILTLAAGQLLPGVPILVVSRLNREEVDPFGNSCSVWLTKPIRCEQLVDAVTGVLNSFR